ncbi:MAG: hypothetical protein IPJ00_19965 [Saprospirales bacterium]|nr:hypothetical protein [Saprospirales bacterium]
MFFSCLSTDQGRPLRVILGALMVKHIEGLSGEDTIQYIQEFLPTGVGTLNTL